MSITQKHIYKLLLDVIKFEVEKKQSTRKREEDKSRNEIQRLENILEKLMSFEFLHYDKLFEIFPDYNYISMGYLSLAYNDIYTRIELYKDPERCTGKYRNQIEQGEDKYFYGPPDTALITYNDFYIATNLNIDSIKKYIQEMVDIGFIQKIKVIGGFEYRILGGI